MKLFLIIVTILISTNSFSQESCSKSKRKKIESLFPKDNFIESVLYMEENFIDDIIKISRKDFEFIYDEIVQYACEIFNKGDLKEIAGLQKNGDLNESLKLLSFVIENINNDELGIDSIAALVVKNKNIDDELREKIISLIKKSGELTGEMALKNVLIEEGFKYDRGTIDFYKHRYHEAYSYFDNLTTTQNDINYYNLLFKGLCELKLDEIDNAIQSFTKACRYNSELSEAEYQLAYTYLNFFQNIDSAYHYIQKAKTKSEDDIYINLLLGKILLLNRNFDSSINILSNIIEEDEVKITALALRGRAYYSKGEFQSAKADLIQVLKSDSIHLNALIIIGDICVQNRNYDSAKYYLDKAIKYYPESDSPYFVYGSFLMSVSEYKKALDYFEKAQQINETIANLNNIGFCKMQLGFYHEASLDFEKVIEKYEKNELNNMVLAFTYNNLGYCHYSLGNLIDALKYVNYSLELYENNSCAFINRAQIKNEQGDFLGACEDIKISETKNFVELCGINLQNLKTKICKN